MEESRTKAYIVKCADDDHGCSVVFADAPHRARQRHPRDVCDCEYIELRAKRAPYLDQHAPGPVPLRTLVEQHGWFTLCQSCESHIYGDHVGAEWDGEIAFCGPDCKAKYDEWWRKLKEPAHV